MKEEKTEKLKITGISESNPEEGHDIKVDLANGLKKKLPENFNLDEIGTIDLREAEKIANEDILFLTEDDLIVGLEDFDLIPLKDDSSPVSEEPDRYKFESKRKTPGDISFGKDASASAEEKEQAIIDSIISSDRGEETGDSGYQVVEEKSETSEIRVPEEAAGKNDLPQGDLAAEESRDGVIPLSGDEPKDGSSFDVVEFSEPDYTLFGENDLDEEPARKEEDKDLLGKRDSKEITPEKIPHEKIPHEEKIITDEHAPLDISSVVLDDSRVRFIDDESIVKEEAPEPAFDDNRLEKIAAEIVDIIDGKSILLSEAEQEEDQEKISTIVTEDRSAYSDVVIDHEDAEYRYRDTDLDIIESSIIDIDYSDYIKKIDDYTSNTEAVTSQKSATSVEIFGLSGYELSGIEDHLFHDEYKDVDIEAEVDLFRGDYGPLDFSETREKNYKYITPDNRKLEETVKHSIEEDLSSDNALIFEEDVNEIARLLGREIPVPEKPAKDESFETLDEEILKSEDSLSDTEIIIEDRIVFEESEEDSEISDLDSEISVSDLEIRVEDFFTDENETAGPQVEVDYSKLVNMHEEIYDITDKIVILEDDIDIDRFIKKFPEEKQDNLKNLLKYLDGLFEKLPESTIKSFADSEYFDLYVKVLNDMGIS